MEFIHKLLEFLSGMSKNAVDKGKQLKEVAHLKSQIAACEDVVSKNYREIGRLYYEKYGGTDKAGEFAKQCTAITNARNGIEDLQEQLRKVKQ